MSNLRAPRPSTPPPVNAAFGDAEGGSGQAPRGLQGPLDPGAATEPPVDDGRSQASPPLRRRRRQTGASIPEWVGGASSRAPAALPRPPTPAVAAGEAASPPGRLSGRAPLRPAGPQRRGEVPLAPCSMQRSVGQCSYRVQVVPCLARRSSGESSAAYALYHAAQLARANASAWQRGVGRRVEASHFVVRHGQVSEPAELTELLRHERVLRPLRLFHNVTIMEDPAVVAQQWRTAAPVGAAAPGQELMARVERFRERGEAQIIITGTIGGAAHWLALRLEWQPARQCPLVLLADADSAWLSAAYLATDRIMEIFTQLPLPARAPPPSAPLLAEELAELEDLEPAAPAVAGAQVQFMDLDWNDWDDFPTFLEPRVPHPLPLELAWLSAGEASVEAGEEERRVGAQIYRQTLVPCLWQGHGQANCGLYASYHARLMAAAGDASLMAPRLADVGRSALEFGALFGPTEAMMGCLNTEGIEELLRRHLFFEPLRDFAHLSIVDDAAQLRGALAAAEEIDLSGLPSYAQAMSNVAAFGRTGAPQICIVNVGQHWVACRLERSPAGAVQMLVADSQPRLWGRTRRAMDDIFEIFSRATGTVQSALLPSAIRPADDVAGEEAEVPTPRTQPGSPIAAPLAIARPAIVAADEETPDMPSFAFCPIAQGVMSYPVTAYVSQKGAMVRGGTYDALWLYNCFFDPARTDAHGVASRRVNWPYRPFVPFLDPLLRAPIIAVQPDIARSGQIKEWLQTLPAPQRGDVLSHSAAALLDAGGESLAAVRGKLQHFAAEIEREQAAPTPSDQSPGGGLDAARGVSADPIDWAAWPVG